MQTVAHTSILEKYSRGRRGAPAKGVGRVYRRESSNLSFSANEKDTIRCPFFVGGRDLNASARERERADRSQCEGGGRRASEQIRSIAPDRAQGDYICEVRCREANRERRENLSAMLALISAKQKPQFQRKGCAFCFFMV